MKNTNVSIRFKAKNLVLWQKLLQAYWVNPKSWLLDEFSVNDDIVSIKCRNGDLLEASVADLTVKCSADKYMRREFTVFHAGRKIHFKEIPWMLKEEEWDCIAEIFGVMANESLGKAAWLLSIGKILIR